MASPPCDGSPASNTATRRSPSRSPFRACASSQCGQGLRSLTEALPAEDQPAPPEPARQTATLLSTPPDQLNGPTAHRIGCTNVHLHLQRACPAHVIRISFPIPGAQHDRSAPTGSTAVYRIITRYFRGKP